VATPGSQSVQVAFDNDFYWSPTIDRNLYLDEVTVACD
jgi:hypothetical protein